MTRPLKAQPDSLCRTSGRDRTGVMVIAALTCLLIVSTIVVGMLGSAIRVRRQLHTQRDLRQTELLLAAGVERAASRIAHDSAFVGDVWELPHESIVGRGTGRVTTKVTRSSSGSHWQVSVVAEYPLDRGFPVRRSQSFDIPFSEKPNKESNQ